MRAASSGLRAARPRQFLVIERFDYAALPARVLFGPGRAAHAADEVRRLSCARALVLSTPGQRVLADRVAAGLGSLAAGVFAGATMHTPVAVTEEALAVFAEHACDCTVAIGGGSAIGLSKALALVTDLPQIVLPTTYAGSEVTPILGQTRDGIKTTQRSPRVLPETVIYDVELTLALPAQISATSGMNAIAHAVEALYARDANPVTSLMAEEGIAALARSLPRIMASPQDLDARAEAQYGAWLCGTCLGSVGMALHHKVCHALGGAFDLPHAQTHSVVLPHAAAYNAAATPEAMRRVARALVAHDAPRGLHRLGRALDVPPSLRAIGMPADGVDHATDLVLRDAYWNPRPLERAAVRRMIARAFEGAPPVVD